MIAHYIVFPRPGASSGILLGTVTLPTVVLSRLIQLSRALTLNDIELEGGAYLNIQYWAVSAGCFGVLIFIYQMLQQSPRNTCSLHLWKSKAFRHSLLYTATYMLTVSLSFVGKSYNSMDVALKLLWLLFHGLATVILTSHILKTFPSCASIGEALLVSSGLVLYFGDMLAHTSSKITASLFSQFDFVELGKKSEISTVIQGVLLGLLLLPALYKSALRIWLHFITSKDSPEQFVGGAHRGIGISIVFYFCLFLILTTIIPAWMYFVQDFHVHPAVWVFNFVFSEPFKRMALCVYWVTVICASVLRFYNISKHSKVERILLRKYYHLVAVLMFVPALLFQPMFLDLAFGAALAVFLILEMIRVWKIWPLGNIVHQFMNAFTDHRDSEFLIVSHFSLLLGCALPKWMSFGFNDRPLAPFAGILSLGIGDTMASMVGHKYGVLRWSKTGKKTIEGTAAGITSVLVACSVLLPLLASTGYILSQHWVSLLVAVTVSGLLEAYTAQLDNAFIPLVFYSLLCL